jgi:ATP-dependent protease ClpP protease subunit
VRLLPAVNVPTEGTVERLAYDWAQLKQAPTLLLWIGDEESIDRDTAEQVYEALQDLPTVDVLWVMLTSSGGDLDGAYQVARLLQSRAKKVCAVIPRWAKSAATLVTLGCHEVVMHPLAELGPLDAQVMVAQGEVPRYRSTLDAMKANEYLRKYAIDTFDVMVSLITQRTATTLKGAGDLAASVTGPLVQPLFAKLDPVDLGEYDRLLSLAADYGKRLMRNSYARLEPIKATKLLEALVRGYPSHSGARVA